jgi:hypothetical protein
MKLEPKEIYYVSALYVNKIATLLFEAAETIAKSSEISDSTKGQIFTILNEIRMTKDFVFDILKTPFLEQDYATESLQLIKTGLSGYSSMLDSIVADTNQKLEAAPSESEDKAKLTQMAASFIVEEEILKNILDKLQDVAIIPEVVEEPKQLIVE